MKIPREYAKEHQYRPSPTHGGKAMEPLPRDYNATTDLIERNLREGRGAKVAIRGIWGEQPYGQLATRMNQAGNALLQLGMEMEQRVILCMLDGPDFPAVFWGAIKAGVVAIPVNTLLSTKEYDYLLRDSRARTLVVSKDLLPKFEPILPDQPFLKHVIVAEASPGEASQYQHLDSLLHSSSTELKAAATCCDDVAFWLYSSGSTGMPKGAIHLHSHLRYTADLYGQQVLGIRPDDVVFSAAKLFFAYGLGNSMTFPYSVGATTVLMSERPTPASVMKVLQEYQPTLFFGVPTLFAAILGDPANDRSRGSSRLRLCVSAGEALPKGIGERWRERFGVDILDGLGSTEMLHIFLSLRPDDIRYGTSGKPVPGYELSIVDEDDRPVPAGQLGELKVRGPSSAMAYWNNRSKSRATFRGEWTFTGDKYLQDEQGYFVYSGRSDDMLKVSGQWVSPIEIESALIAHPQVLEVAVVGKADENQLIKPQAFVVLKQGHQSSSTLAEELKQFVKSRLAPHKYPRWVQFLESLPKTATGKIQRYKLR
jgi:4-hydroxybenzoate-CoA ligase/benzoate-CoA ligase